jgi:hypothetical protein
MNRLRNRLLAHPIRWTNALWWWCERREWSTAPAEWLQNTLVGLEHAEGEPQLRRRQQKGDPV